tara:strand:- start:148 stop:513 length:366 start_codon:yes stop_codon:yes gene_type:complete
MSHPDSKPDNPYWAAARKTYNDEARSLLAKNRTFRHTQNRIVIDKKITKELAELRVECRAAQQSFVDRDASYKTHFSAARHALLRITQLLKDLKVEHQRILDLEQASQHPEGLPQIWVARP